MAKPKLPTAPGCMNFAEFCKLVKIDEDEFFALPFDKACAVRARDLEAVLLDGHLPHQRHHPEGHEELMKPIYGEIAKLLVARGWKHDPYVMVRPDGEVWEFSHPKITRQNYPGGPKVSKRMTLFNAVLAQADLDEGVKP